MKKYQITDLRDHLFETIEWLKQDKNPMEIDRAKAIAEVAQIIVNSAKVEVEYIKATDSNKGSGFIKIGDNENQHPNQIKIGLVK